MAKPENNSEVQDITVNRGQIITAAQAALASVGAVFPASDVMYDQLQAEIAANAALPPEERDTLVSATVPEYVHTSLAAYAQTLGELRFVNRLLADLGFTSVEASAEATDLQQ